MLSYAYCVLDYYFDGWPGLSTLKTFFSNVDCSISWVKRGVAEEMVDRGQMGVYFREIIDSIQ